MQAHGTFFMSKQRPEAATGPDGVFRLTLRLIDVLSSREKEAVQVRWEGPAAATWWQAHHAAIPAGTPIEADLERLRAHVGNTYPAIPELRARVVRLYPVPPRTEHPQPETAAHAA